MEPRYPLLPLALLLTVWSHAQPTITWGDAPTNGDAVSYSGVESNPSIPAGAGQTWVLTGNVSLGVDVDFLSPSTSPGHLNWPDATVVSNQGGQETYVYWKADGTGLSTIGRYNNSDGSLTDYIDAQRYMAYPCTFGTTWTDGYSTSPMVNGTPDFIGAPRTYTADGYGTLVGNAGSMTNVLKVHNEQVSDTVINGASHITSYIEDTFWKPGYPMYVAYALSYTNYIDGQLQGSYNLVLMVDQLAIGIPEESSQAIGISLVPNPAQDELRVTFGVAGDATISVLDALGREVLATRKEALAPGIHQELLDVASLSPGAFLVRIVTADGQVGCRKLVIDR